MRPAVVKDVNPLDTVEIHVELLYKSDALESDQSGAFRIHEDIIEEGIKKLFKQRFVNRNE